MRDIQSYEPIAQAIEALLHPWAEVVIHDLRTNKIAAIYNNFSKRRVGEDSLLEKELSASQLPDFFQPYYKTNWDGKRIKSTTATLRDSQGLSIALLCINLDISHMEECQKWLSSFMGSFDSQLFPKELFQDDWKEKISCYVHDYLKQNQLNLKILSKEEKQKLIGLLYQEGAFRSKHAASYVGSVLQISRATVYKYLKALNQKE
jgi:D-arginine utilization repressor